LVLVLANSYYLYNLNGQIAILKDELREISGPVASSFPEQNELKRSSFSIAEKSIPIVAVAGDELGVMGEMNLRLIPGSNDCV
jgi:hypothetical protein